MAASLAARRDRNIILGAGITAGSILSVVGILQYFNIVPHPWWALDNCLSATFINHNHFSGYLEIAIPAALGLSVSLRKRQSPVALFLVVLLAVIVMSIAFVLAQSRGGWISLGTGLFAMTTVLSAKRLLPRWSLFAYVIILAAVFITAYLKEDNVSERIESMTSSFEQELDKETSLGTRFAIWKDTIRIVRDHPLSGTGIGTFHWSFIGHRTKAVHSTRPYYVYNEYLQAAAESGVPATIIMIAFILAVLVIGYRSSSATMIGCATGILSLALHGLIDFNFHIPSNLLFFILCAGFIIHSKNNER
jgi:O-antigen ligase